MEASAGGAAAIAFGGRTVVGVALGASGCSVFARHVGPLDELRERGECHEPQWRPKIRIYALCGVATVVVEESAETRPASDCAECRVVVAG